jgi:hypothetical protein
LAAAAFGQEALTMAITRTSIASFTRAGAMFRDINPEVFILEAQSQVFV